MENLGILLQKFNSILRESEFPDSLLREIHGKLNDDKIIAELKVRLIKIQSELDHIAHQINPENETGELQKNSDGAAD